MFKFLHTAQICAKTLKFETHIYLFSRTHTGGLLRAQSKSFFPQIFNRVQEASLRSPVQYLSINQCQNLVNTGTDKHTHFLCAVSRLSATQNGHTIILMNMFIT